MEEKEYVTDKWMKSAAGLAEAYKDLLAIRLVEHTSNVVSFSIIGLLALVLGFFILLFAGLGCAWWLGEYMQNTKAGFFIVGGAFTLIFTIVLVASKSVLIPQIRNLIIKKAYEQD
jgi:uncharacterized membrane protein